MNHLFTNIGSIFRNSVRSLVKSKDLIPQNGASYFTRDMHTFRSDFNFLQCTSLWFIPVRNNVRNHFPRPRETKRIKCHGWRARMATLSGRKILMRRILKGKHVLSH